MYICIWEIQSLQIYNFHIRISWMDQIFDTENQQNRNKTWHLNYRETSFVVILKIESPHFDSKNVLITHFFCFWNFTRINGLFYVYFDHFQSFFDYFWRKCIFVHDYSILSFFGVYCILSFEPNIHIQCIFVYFFKTKVIYVCVYPMHLTLPFVKTSLFLPT